MDANSLPEVYALTKLVQSTICAFLPDFSCDRLDMKLLLLFVPACRSYRSVMVPTELSWRGFNVSSLLVQNTFNILCYVMVMARGAPFLEARVTAPKCVAYLLLHWLLQICTSVLGLMYKVN